MSINFNPQKFVVTADSLKKMHGTSKKEGHAEKTFSLQSGEYTIKMESVPRSRNPLKSMFGLLKKTQITVTSQSGNFTTTYNRGTGIKDVENQLNRLENRAISARSASAANATNFATTAAAAKARTAAAAATTTAAPTPAATGTVQQQQIGRHFNFNPAVAGDGPQEIGRHKQQAALEGKPPNERAAHYMKAAQQFLNSGKDEMKEFALEHLMKADEQWDSPDGQATFARLPQDQRIKYHEQQVELLQKAGGNSAAISLHKQQAALEGKPANERATHYMNMAERYYDKELARELLNQADEQWDSPEGQAEWVRLPQEQRVEYHQRQAELLQKAGGEPVMINYHNRQAAFEGKPANERVAHYMDMTLNLQGFAQGNLELIERQWQSPEGQVEWQKMGPIGHVDYFQKMANLSIIRANDKEGAEVFLHHISDELSSPDGQAAFARLPQDQRIKFHEQQAELLQKAGGNQTMISHHKQQAAFEGKPTNERATHYMNMAERYHDKELARELLNQADEQWDSPEGQAEWVRLPQEQRVEYHQRQAELLQKAGGASTMINYHKQQAAFEGKPANERATHYMDAAQNLLNRMKEGQKELALMHLNQADEQWNSPEGQAEWARLPRDQRIKYHRQQTELRQKAGDNPSS